MILKYSGDYTKKQTLIDAMRVYNRHIKTFLGKDGALNNMFRFDDYIHSNKQLNKIYVLFKGVKHYISDIQIDTYTSQLIITIK